MSDSATEDEIEELEQRPRKLVALMLNASSKNHRSLEKERYVASQLHCAYLDYDDARLLLTELRLMAAGEGKLNEAAYGVLRNTVEAQLSFGRSVFVVSPVERDEYRAHLDGLVELADLYGFPLIVVEVKRESEEDDSEVMVDLNGIPHLILPLGNSKHAHDERAPANVSFDYAIRSFVHHFDSMPEFVTNSGDSIPDSAKFRHFSHRHPLLLNTSADRNVEKADHCCSVCAAAITGQPYYSCLCCSFFLHKRCAELPQHIKSLIHSHPLRLVVALWEKSERCLFSYLNLSDRNLEFKIKCLVCDSEEQQPFYGCFHCYDLFVHDECIHSLQHVIEHQLHPHPLTMETMKTNLSGHDYRCYACGGEGNMISYSCRECHFDFHIKCALSLQPSVRHKCHEDHPLLLSMPPKDETNEYYCEVCEERRHPDYWIYYCEECEYEAHPHCVLEGVPPYTYIEEQEGDDDDNNGSSEDDPEDDDTDDRSSSE